MQNLEPNGSSIWLRYSTQIQRDGQVHTIEISVPVPVGASPEQREQLIHEAEAGMGQLVQHMSQRIPQMFQGASSPRISPRPMPVGNMSAQEQVVSVATQPAPTQRPASMSAPQMGTQPSVGERQSRSEPVVQREEIIVPPTRPSIGASMPLALGPTLDSSGNLPLPEFIKYIQDNLNLTPRQAMQMLNRKSLAGVNLRDALDRLKVMLRNNPEGIPLGQPIYPSPVLSQPDLTQEEEPERRVEEQDTQIIEIPAVPRRAFDEEEEETFEEDSEEQDGEVREFDTEQLDLARTKIHELREYQGASIASAKRLQALTNVTDSQISMEQLQQLISGVWHISALKKLKMDQVEALISWAKQDDFIDDIEVTLFLLEEERYARGNR